MYIILLLSYCKILKIKPGAYICRMAFLRGLFLRGLYLELGAYLWREIVFQNRLGSFMVGRKFTLFALFYFVFEGNFQVQAPRRGGLIFKGVIRGVIYCGIIFIIDTGHHKIDFLSFSSHLLVHCICHHQWLYWTTIQTLQKQMEVSVNSWIFSLVLLHWHCFALQFLPMDVIDLDCKCNL